MPTLPRLVVGDHHRAGAGFRHRPGLDQREAEARLERRMQAPVDAGAEAEAHAVVAVVGAAARPISIDGITPR